MAASEPPAEIPSAARDLLLNPGSKLGPYEIVSAVGAGGMGEVYRARDTRLDRVVANYDVSPNGQRFLMIKASEQERSATTQINVVLNWFEELKRRVLTGEWTEQSARPSPIVMY